MNGNRVGVALSATAVAIMLGGVAAKCIGVSFDHAAMGNLLLFVAYISAMTILGLMWVALKGHILGLWELPFD